MTALVFSSAPYLVAADARDPALSRAGVRAVMTKVCDWQLANFSHETINRAEHDVAEAVAENGWIRGATFAGIVAHFRTFRDPKILAAAETWAERNDWKPGPKPRHADDQCVIQAYADLYFLTPDPKKLAGARADFDLMIADPKWGPESGWSKTNNWSWSDALFMAPPAMARVAQATHEQKYLTLMDRLWWDTHAYLYDPAEHLYFRDATYKLKPDGSGPRTPAGKKVFWSRGNGWVLAGLARTLQYLPADYSERPKYTALFREMASRVAELQGGDGLWRSSLNEPDWFPAPESSGTALFCFAIAWGVNAGLLDREMFAPVAIKAWQGLQTCVRADGKIGWVQLTGHDPRPVYERDTLDYAAGAFLLAGEQIVKLSTISSP